VPCREAIGHTPFPQRSAGYRTVLGAISVPGLAAAERFAGAGCG
jgi:hypothetical protein